MQGPGQSSGVRVKEIKHAIKTHSSHHQSLHMDSTVLTGEPRASSQSMRSITSSGS